MSKKMNKAAAVAEDKKSKEAKANESDNKREAKANERNIKKDQEKAEKKKKTIAKKKAKSQDIRWDKLDNTANLFPVIATENMTNVYRISITLSEDIEPELLQKAIVKVLPYFDVFNVRMKKGVFWYYFETNRKEVPEVTLEDSYPCMYINPYTNHDFLFRFTYYQNRINLEVFHVLTDGNGALMFLKEVTYQYLRYKHPELVDVVGNTLSADTSLDKEDSYIKNYKKAAKRSYKTKRAVIIKGEKLSTYQLGVMHGYISLEDIKRVSKSYGVTINQYLVTVYLWSIYQEYLKGQPSKKPITCCIPVNLRPYFESSTTKNFFVIVTAIFKPEKDDYTFEEVLEITCKSLAEQINKENLERMLSYNVSNQMNYVLRAIPLFIKRLAIKYVYNDSAKANTTTMTNLGIIKVDDAYKDYIKSFYAILSMSKGQNIKTTVFSYDKSLVLTFSSILRDTGIQKTFFRRLSSDGISLSVETNGVYYD